MAGSAPLSKCDATAHEGIDDGSDKPGSPPPTTPPNIPQGPPRNIAAPPAQGPSDPWPVQSQSRMTDYQVVERNENQDGPSHAGQPAAASGEIQPTGPVDGSNFHTRALNPQQAMSDVGMSRSVPGSDLGSDDHQPVSARGCRASLTRIPNANRSPTPSSCSDDSMTMHIDGDAPPQSTINGQVSRRTAARSAKNAQHAQGARTTSPATRERINQLTFASDCFHDMVGSTTPSGDLSRDAELDISDEERPGNP